MQSYSIDLNQYSCNGTCMREEGLLVVAGRTTMQWMYHSFFAEVTHLKFLPVV
jgi:hypothetical protein